MALDYYNGINNNDINRAHDISMNLAGVNNAYAFPLNIVPIPILASFVTPKLLDLLLKRGPVYARYDSDESGHYVVVTGINIDDNKVYTINPQWGKEGYQDFDSFKNGVYYPPGSSYDYRLTWILISTTHENMIIKPFAQKWFHWLYKEQSV